MRRRSLLATLGGLAAGLVGASAEAAEPRQPTVRGYLPMVASPVIALSGGAGAMREVRVADYGVPAAARGVHLAGWAAVVPPGKLWAFSEKFGQHTGAYHVREASVDWMFVPVSGGEFCVMGSGGWNVSLRITGYWI